MTRVEFSDVVAGLALAISGATFVTQRRAGGRVHFTAEWADHHTIILINQGPGFATKVSANIVSSQGP